MTIRVFSEVASQLHTTMPNYDETKMKNSKHRSNTHVLPIVTNHKSLNVGNPRTVRTFEVYHQRLPRTVTLERFIKISK